MSVQKRMSKQLWQLYPACSESMAVKKNIWLDKKIQ
jgi:hypothetical protein